MKTSRIIIILLLVIGGLLAISYFVKGKKKDKGEEVTAEATSIQTITETVTASGKIHPEKEVKISSDVSGEIVFLNVKEGEPVMAGQLLAKVKPDNYQALLEQTEANYNNANANISNAKARLKQIEAQVENANTSFKRAQELYDAKAMSKQDFEQAQSALKTAQAEYEAAKYTIQGAEFSAKGAQASVKDAKNNINKTVLYAPISGKISLLNVEQGEKVVGTLQMSGTELMRIADFDNLEVRVDVSENEIIRVKVGDTADVEVDAYIGKKFKGLVTEVSSSSKGIANAGLSAVSNDQATNYVVKVRVLKSSYEYLLADNPVPFRPGMSATVEIKTKKVEDVVVVPIAAVTTRVVNKDNPNGEPEEVVFVVENGKAKMKKVETGIQDNLYIQILSGLKKGEKVITGPYEYLNKDLEDGKLVKVVDKKKLAESMEEEK
ncbi:MAG: efflux RND transporter periplasmic adaptor subunit [Chitinophagales bacterium]|nr:efflux RND transporter periplasmic adaptor subunit [Chitinophagales bacterium]